MKKKHRHIAKARKFTSFYVLVISIVLVLSLGSLLSTLRIIHKHSDYTAVIEISQRQEMLSQRTILLMHRLCGIPESETDLKNEVRKQLNDCIDLMAESHNILTTGNLPDGSSFEPSPALLKMYFDQPLMVDRLVKEYLSGLRELLQTPNQKKVQELLQHATGTLLSSLHEVTQQYKTESRQFTQGSKNIGFFIFILRLIVLFCVIFLIVRPIVQRIVNSELTLNSLLDHLPVYMDIVNNEGTVLYQSRFLLDTLDSEDHGKKCPVAIEGTIERCPECPMIYKGKSTGKIFKSQNCLGDKILQRSQVGITFQGQPAILQTFTDITEQHKTERYLIEAKESAEKANALKSEFMASMSHEIKTPLNSINGLIYLMSETQITPRQREYLNKMDTSANRLTMLIDDLLDFSILETDDLRPETLTFNFFDIMDNLSSSLALHASKKELEVNFNVEPNVPPYVVGDPYRLEQILKELVKNAIKFTDVGFIDVHVESLKTKDDDRIYLKISVDDTGIGISPQFRDHLFQPFSQGESSDNRKQGGTGMGLSMCLKIAKLMDGDLTIEEKEGPGSLFVLHVPLQIASEHEKECSPPHPYKKILIVDDHSFAQHAIQNLLRTFNLQSEAVSTAEEAIREVKTAKQSGDPYDLLLMENQLKGLTGVELSKTIKSGKGQYGDPTILLIATEASLQAIDKADRMFDDIIQKPVSRTVLSKALATVTKSGIREHDALKGDRPFTLPSHLPGIDLSKGVAQAGGNKKIYASILNKFTLNHATKIECIKQAYEQGDLPKAHRLIHTLKGVSGNMGAMALHSAAKDLETLFKDGGKISSETFYDKLNQVKVPLQQVLKSISSVQDLHQKNANHQPPQQEKPIDLKQVLPLMCQLIQLLEESDTDAEQLIEKLLATPKQMSVQKKFKHIQDLISQYEFEKALELVLQLKTDLEG
ncbi:MAG: hypothetical protein CR997_10140 [Acidobacteria bacterium]|nr:MAG: hypothetical protein CR997_10140 [Acidobacteriota bacterium]